MLDRSKLLHDISRLSSQLFPDTKDVVRIALHQWNQIKDDPSFQQRVDAAQSSFLVPGWTGSLDDVVSIKPYTDAYTVVSVDGSQIYPDRHVSGAGCFLLNVGGVVVRYGAKSSIELFNTPHVMLPEQVMGKDPKAGFSSDLVDLEREALELETSVIKAGQVLEQQPDPGKCICLVDGTLIFWPLDGKQSEIKQKYLDRYLRSLDFFYHHKFPIAGYISMPKSKEVMSLIKLSLCRFSVASCIPCHATYSTFPCRAVDALIDTMLMRQVIGVGERTTIFGSNSKIVENYPERLRPHFFYLDVGKEIARVEVPAWMVDDEQCMQRLCGMIIDQACKGQGYPITIAEAHEQAVVKGPDREFFLTVLRKVGMDSQRRVRYSQKSMKKRGMGV